MGNFYAFFGQFFFLFPEIFAIYINIINFWILYIIVIHIVKFQLEETTLKEEKKSFNYFIEKVFKNLA